MNGEELRRKNLRRYRRERNEARERIVAHLRDNGYALDGTEPMENLVAALNELWAAENMARVSARRVEA